MIWWHWALLGLGCLGVEILTLGGLGNLYFLFFGIAALIVSLLVALGLAEPAWMQWLLFASLGLLSLFALQKPLQRRIRPTVDVPSSTDSLIGEVAIPLEDIPIHAAGKAELHGSTWTACNLGPLPVKQGERCRVVRTDGLTLGIQAESIAEEDYICRVK